MTCPECGRETCVNTIKWMVDEERYKIITVHYCPACGWTDDKEGD